MNEEIFLDIGFTKAETKIYLALLELGETTAGSILYKTKLQNSTVHKTIKRLVAKGFVSFIIKGKIHYYQATDPKNVLQSITEKKQKFEAILPELDVLQKPTEKQHAEIFEGFRGFKNMLYELISDGEPGDEFLFFAFDTKNPEEYKFVYNFYSDFDNERFERGFDVKGIAPAKLKNMIKLRKAELLFVDFPIPLNCSVFRDKIIFTPWEDKMVSFLIHSRQLAESYRQLFYSIWDSGKENIIKMKNWKKTQKNSYKSKTSQE